MKLSAAGIVVVTLICGSFYLGLYVGSVHGILYYFGLHSDDLIRLITELEFVEQYGEAYEGELYDTYNYRLTTNIQWYGEHLEQLQPFLKVPSPLHLKSTGESSMNYAVRYRIDNPHVRKAPPLSEEEEREIEESVIEEFGPVTDEQQRELQAMKEADQENYDRAVQHVQSIRDDA